MLTELGATAAEDLVYQHLVSTVSATETEIVEATGLPRTESRRALDGLRDRDLVSRLSGSPARFVAASPGAVESMIIDRLRGLRSAQDTLDQIASQYRANSLLRTATGVFEIVRGSEALRQCSLQLLRSARTEVLNLIKPPVISVRASERVLPSESVQGRVVFETGELHADGSLDAVQETLRSQDEVRVHARLPIKMLATDRTVALLPLAQQDTTPVGVLVRESAVLDALLGLFDYVWASAIPLHVVNANAAANADADADVVEPDVPSPLTDADRHLLSLLLSGLTDEAIAAHWGVSVRTVQRRVRALMSAAKVSTRMQLAWEAARQGWM